MILVFGGTTEGKKVIAELSSNGHPFLYTTKTKTDWQPVPGGQYRYGILDEEQLEHLVINEKVSLIINAAHPFATTLHQTIANVATQFQRQVIRIERPTEPKVKHHQVHYVENYDEATTLLKKLGNPKLLALSGVQSIPKLTSYWKKTTTYFRILDRPTSFAIAKASHFPQAQIIAGYPSLALEEEITLIKKLGVEAILTKESGTSGLQQVKIKAALANTGPHHPTKKATTTF